MKIAAYVVSVYAILALAAWALGSVDSASWCTGTCDFISYCGALAFLFLVYPGLTIVEQLVTRAADGTWIVSPAHWLISILITAAILFTVLIPLTKAVARVRNIN